MNDDELDALLDPAIESLRAEWIVLLRELVRLSAALAPTLHEHDEALSSSLEFVALRTQRVVDRLAGQGILPPNG